MTKIVTYSPKYCDAFIALNSQWIETYFKIEESDIETFSHVDSIIDDGGQIFIAISVLRKCHSQDRNMCDAIS